MKAIWRVTIDGCSIIALGISLFLIFTNFPNTEATKFDYQAILVGILAAIFTLLVGWNIYNVIDFRKKESLINELEVRLQSQIDKDKKYIDNNYAISMSYVASMLALSITPRSKESLLDKMIFTYIICIKCYNHSKDFQQSTKQLNALLSHLEELSDIKLEQAQKNKLLIKLGEIEYRDKLPKIEELINYLSR